MRGHETAIYEKEFVLLAGKTILPCRACLGCVKDNVCGIDDDLRSLRERIVSADAYVIGAPNYFSVLNGQSHCFLERWYQFRHREGPTSPARSAWPSASACPSRPWRTSRSSSNTIRCVSMWVDVGDVQGDVGSA